MKRYRLLKQEERRQRGCDYCEDCHKKHWCPYEFCPYTEMDGFTKYKDYMEATGGESVRKLLRKKVKHGTND